MNLLNETYRVWAMHREFRTVLAELNSYSDRELTGLGLARGDVVRAAYAEAERRIGRPQPQPGAATVVGWAQPASAPGS